MNNLSRILTVGLLVLLLPACATSPKTNFYLLSSDKEVYSERDPEQKSKSENAVESKVSIGLWKIKLPELIDRPEIVTRTGPHTIELADFDHWADDLENNISTLIASEISHDLHTGYVYISPWPSSKKLDYQIKVHIRKFVGELDGDVKLEGAYIILVGKGKKKHLEEPFSLSKKTKGNSYKDMVSTMSRLVIRLSAQISTTISDQLNNKS